MKKILFVTLLVLAEVAISQSLKGVVTGRIVTRDGSPAVGVRVGAVAVPVSNGFGADLVLLAGLAETDSMGRYQLEDLPSGPYLILAGPLDSPTYYPGTTSVSAATKIMVSDSTPAHNIDFTVTLPVSVTVRGRVIAPASIPVDELRVSMESQSSRRVFFEARVSANGTFQFSDVRPGDYMVEIEQTNETFRAADYKTVVVTDHDIEGITLAVKDLAIVNWNAIVEGGGLVPRFTMSLISLEGTMLGPVSFTLQGTLLFRHVVAEGDYRVAWSGLPAGYRIKSVTSGLTDVLSNSLKATPTEETFVLVTLGVSSPPPWVKVTGRVTGATTRVPSIELLRVILSGDTTARPIPAAPVNADGTFEFPMVLPGRYVARVATRDDQEGSRPPESLMVPVVVVVPSQDVPAFQFEIPRVKTITARVTIDGNAEPPKAISFRFGRIQGGPEITTPGQLQPDGKTFKVDAPEGNIRIMLDSVPGFTVRDMSYKSVNLRGNLVTVEANDNEEILVTLAPFVPTGFTFQ